MMNLLKRLYKDEEGQAMAEYGLVLALVAVVVMAGLTVFGDNLKAFFDELAKKITYTT